MRKRLAGLTCSAAERYYRNSFDRFRGYGLVLRFVAECSMDGETLDQCIEDACGGRVEVLLKRLSAAGHPGVGDVSVGRFPGGQGVELMGEDEVALVAEDIVGDGVGDGRFGGVGVVGGGDSLGELFAGAVGKSGEGLVE